MRKRWFHAPELHVGQAGRVKRVTWLEIFYDLLVAAAFLQLGHGLSAGLSLLQFVACALPLWLTWTGFTFLQNRFDVADLLHRFLVFLQMAAIGVMGASVAHDALDTFCLAASTALFLIAAIYLRAYWAVPEARDYCALWGSAFALGAAAWLSAGYAGSEESFYAAGGVSMATMIVPLTPRARALGERYRIDFVHIGKRYALLTLIVLGQVFTDTVPMLATSEMGAEDLFEIGVLFSLLCAIWWIYFDDVAGAPLRPGPLKSTVWLYAHLPLLLGAVVLDVGVLKAASTAYGAPLSPEIRWMLSGSVALIFACVAAIDAVTERADATISDRARINTRWMSALVVLLLAPATSTVDSWVFLSLLLALTLSQVVFDLMFAPYSETNRDVLDDPEPVDVAAKTSSRPESQRIVRKGTPAGLRRDLFFFLVEGSWGRVFVLFGFAFLLTNLLFAGLYMLEPGSIAGAEVGSFGDAFSFSVQTMSTIGFGGMTPGTPYGDLLVALEAGVTMIGIAIITGFVVAKATRPYASVLFSRVMTLTKMDGRYVLAFRVGNARGNEVVDANVSVSALIDETTAEGHRFRRVHDLTLRRSRTPLFSLSWTVLHTIDDESPLASVDFRDPDPQLRFFIVTLTGHDGTYAQTIHARHNYYLDEIRIDERFVDVIQDLEDGGIMIDYAKFHLTEPDHA